MKPGNRAANRARGFRAALAGRGCARLGDRSSYESFLGDLRQANRVALGEVLARPRVDCVFATNERSAISMIATAPQFGISIPDDLAVAGFGDIEAAALIAPGLTTVRIKGDQMGYRAIELLLAHLQKGTDIAAHVEDVGYEIVWRGSA